MGINMNLFRRKEKESVPIEWRLEHKELSGVATKVISNHLTQLQAEPTQGNVDMIENWLKEIHQNLSQGCYDYVFGVYAHILRDKGVYDKYRGR